jgi:hypothetical protein
MKPQVSAARFDSCDSGEPDGKVIRRRFRGDPVDQHNNVNPAPTPKDARKATEEQRQLQEELDHQGDDPDAPGLQQSWRKVADETTR